MEKKKVDDLNDDVFDEDALIESEESLEKICGIFGVTDEDDIEDIMNRDLGFDGY
jgi:hypothetical protein